jgi:hypothetical protein
MVYVPWTRLDPDCVAALGLAAYVFVGDDRTQYWRLVRQLWDTGEPFIIVEHDVIVGPTTLTDLDTCPQPWCANAVHSVDVGTGQSWVATFGCVRFRPSGAYPLADPVDWTELDMATERALLELGWEKHVHWPLLASVNPGLVEYTRLVAMLMGT